MPSPRECPARRPPAGRSSRRSTPGAEPCVGRPVVPRSLPGAGWPARRWRPPRRRPAPDRRSGRGEIRVAGVLAWRSLRRTSSTARRWASTARKPRSDPFVRSTRSGSCHRQVKTSWLTSQASCSSRVTLRAMPNTSPAWSSYTSARARSSPASMRASSRASRSAEPRTDMALRYRRDTVVLTPGIRRRAARGSVSAEFREIAVIRRAGSGEPRHNRHRPTTRSETCPRRASTPDGASTQ